jgi:phosphoribosylamine--glycine ligase
VIGKGGREHALVWKLARSPRVRTVYCAPGNAGTALDANNVPIDPSDTRSLVQFAKQNQIALTVVGPEDPLVNGLVDAFRAQGLRIFGPTKAAAQLEGSKSFAKELMRHAAVPTADFRTFDSQVQAEHFVQEREETPLVVKADGLAAGKGAIVCQTREQALAALDRMMRRREFGRAGDRVVIEEKLVGVEVSVLAITDGRTIARLEPAQDHKAAYDNDEGPNTGGMGAYSPAPMLDAEMLEQIDTAILVPTIHAMKRRRTPFQGVLYAGIMLTAQGPKVLEFNVRLGDPETQPILMRLKTDLAEILDAAVDGRLDQLGAIEWDARPAVCVVMASEGYPGPYMKGQPVRGLDDAATVPDSKVFHAGTVLRDGEVYTDGGRLLGATALGDSIADAKRRSYEIVRKIRSSGAWCRHDISDKALQWLRESSRLATD